MVSVVIDCDDMLGPYDHAKKLNVGIVQKMIYDKKDNYGDDESGPAFSTR